MAGPKFGALNATAQRLAAGSRERVPLPFLTVATRAGAITSLGSEAPRAVPPESGAMRNGITPIYCCASRRKIRQSQA